MKRFKKRLLIPFILLIIFSLSMGCSSTKDTKYESGSSSKNSIIHSMDSREDVASESDSNNDEYISDNIDTGPEKLITTMSFHLETTEFNKTNEELTNLIRKYSGYVENSNISYNQNHNRKILKHGSFYIRIPKKHLDDFKLQLYNIGNTIWESTSKEDLTKEYKDTETRLKVIEVKEERILSLLEKAEKIEDIIALEEQLSQIISEKEIYKQNLLYIDDQVDFTTVNLDIQEVESLTNPETLDTGFRTRIKNAMKNSIFRFKKSMEDIFIGSIYFIPYLLILILLIFIAYRVYKILFNRKNKS